MKFYHRLLILAVSGFIVLIYLSIFDSVHLAGLIHSEHHVSYRDSPYRADSLSGKDKLTGTTVCTGLEQRTPTANMSTLDLQQQTNYDLSSDGNYILPSHKVVVDTGETAEPLTVIVVPHSHNDPGWLRTLEEYYVYNTKNILNNMVDKLRIYPNMTFVWAETVFLSMWWNELEDDMKAQVRRLVRRGQLEIVSGGWVMPDEASTHYASVIDQLMEGHQWVVENLNVKPTNSWSIDPFGHSGTMPYLWKQSGLENMVIQRIHQATKGTLAQGRNLEFYWRQFWDTKGKSDILCHVMPYMLYNIKFTCGPDRFVCLMFDFRKPDGDFRKTFAEAITLKTVARQAQALYQQYRHKASLYKYNVILVPLGDDFRYEQASEWDQQYQNYNMLMRYMNEKPEWNINIKFGTLKDYFEAHKQLVEETGDLLTTLSGDFFPYSDRDYSYWTGYYSTRPFDKYFSREVEMTLRAAESLNVLTRVYCRKWDIPYKQYLETATMLQHARRNLGLFLHHDAITGTSKSYVVEDYERLLLAAYSGSQNVIKLAIQTLLSQGHLQVPVVLHSGVTRKDFKSLPEKQVIPISDSGTKVILFNPLLRERTEIISVFVDTDNFVIRYGNDIIPHQINPVWDSTTSVHPNIYEVLFLKELSPLSVDTLMFYKQDKPQDNSYPAKITVYNTMMLGVGPHQRFYQERPRHSKNFKGSIFLENEFLEVKFNSDTGILDNVIDKITGNATKIDLSFQEYKSQGSGAYLFHPQTEATSAFTATPVIRVIEGPLMSQVEVLNPHIQHTVRLYNHPGEQGRGVHIYNTVNMQAADLKDKEIIMKLKTDVDNSDLTYFTDQNGFQLIKRRTNTKLRTEANYYPLSTMAVLEDGNKRVTLHTAQPHGVGCLRKGELEVMLDRQLLYDDERGLGEGVLDNKPTVSRFVLQIEAHTSASRHQQTDIIYPSLLSLAMNALLQQPVMDFFTHQKSDVLSAKFSPIKNSLPCDMTLVSFKNLVNKNLDYTGTSLILHRHGYQCGFPTGGLQCHLHSNTSMSSLFSDIQIHSARETTLTHMYDKGVVDIDAALTIPPMELAAYTLTL